MQTTRSWKATLLFYTPEVAEILWNNWFTLRYSVETPSSVAPTHVRDHGERKPLPHGAECPEHDQLGSPSQSAAL